VADGRLLPNWIQAYLAYTAESESPEEYHLWVAVSVIGGALRRRVFFPMGYFQLYANNYIVLVGPPGRCKKSTAMRIGRTLLTEIPGIKFTTDSVTRERLIQDLTQAYIGADGHSSMTAYSSEFATLLTSSGMDMVSFLTDIYDSPPIWEHSSKTGGTNKIKAPYLNMIAGTTPDWIAKAMPMDTVGIGLTSRIVFVYQDTPRVKDPFPELSPEQVQLQQLLLHDLNQIALLGGQFGLSKEAKSYYSAWYKDRLANPNPTGDNRLSGYFERKPMHVLKVAMTVSAATKNELVLTSEDIENAIGLLAQVEEKMPRVFANVGKNPLSADTDEVEMAILEAGVEGLGMKDLIPRFKHSLRKDELAEVLDTLLQSEKVKLAGNRYVSLRLGR
jgi:Protein of unknown function (DUF3987)